MTAPRGLRALVVDDDPTYRRILSRSLQKLGVEEVLTAGDIGIARSKIERGGIDLVTIDVVLRDESGLDLLTWLRSHHPEVVPVLVTAGTVVIPHQKGLLVATFLHPYQFGTALHHTGISLRVPLNVERDGTNPECLMSLQDGSQEG